MTKKLLFVFVLLFGVSMVAPAQAAPFSNSWYGQATAGTAPTWSGGSYSFSHNTGFQNDFANRQQELRRQLQNSQAELRAEWQSQNQQFRVNFEQRRDTALDDFSSRFPVTDPGQPSNGNGNGGDDGNVDGNGNGDDIDVPSECTVANLSEITNYPPPSGPIIAFGNSLTAGVGASPGQDYVSELERRGGVSIINAGVPGDTTADALARLNEDVLRYNPSTVIVFLGGNDILYRYYDRLSRTAENRNLQDVLVDIINRLFGKVPEGNIITEEETFNNLQTIVTEIQSTGAMVILVGLSGRPFDSNVSADYQRVAEETGAILVPDALNGIVGIPSRMSDLIHPNDRGYDILANRIYGALACVL
jgi:acyl-CoA thioesterase I